MLPNIHIYEKIISQQMHERQYRAAQQRLCKKSPRYSLIRMVIGRLGSLFLSLGTRMKQLEVAAD